MILNMKYGVRTLKNRNFDFFCQTGIKRLSQTLVSKMLLAEENHSSTIGDTLTPVFPFDSFINGLIGE